MVDKGLSIPIQHFEFAGEDEEEDVNRKEEKKSDLGYLKTDLKRNIETRSKHPLGLRPYSTTKKLLFNQSANPQLDLIKLKQESHNSFSRNRLHTDRNASQKKLLQCISSSTKNSKALLSNNSSQNYQPRRKIQFDDWVQRARIYAKRQISRVHHSRELAQSHRHVMQSTKDILEVNGCKHEYRAINKINYSPKGKKMIRLDLRKLLRPKII